MKQFSIPKEVEEISGVLTDAGFESFLVGGCVRDLLLDRAPKDWDIATIATPEEIQKIFPDSFYENCFGTVGVKTDLPAGGDIVEVTPYRLESEYSDARHPDKVVWADKIEEDLARRDFTINAMALEVRRHSVSMASSTPSVGETSKLIDPFDGQIDLEKKIIRTVGSPDVRFREDALRLFRALRLAAELNFAIEHETQESIRNNSDLLTKISKERIRDEFTKIVMSDNPATALELAARLGLLKYISEEFEKGIGVEQGGAHAYTVWEHLLRSLNHAAQKKFSLHVRLATLFHDIAKPHTRRKQGSEWSFYGHEVVGAKIARKVLEDLKFSKEIIEKVGKLVRWHMFFSDTEQITLSAVRRVVRNVGPELIWDLMNTRVADRIGTGRPKEEPYRLRKYQSMIEEVMRDPISVKQLAINGENIMKIIAETGGTSPRRSGLLPREGGPHIGFILEILLSEVLNDPKLNTKEYLENKVKELHALDSKELETLGRAARASNESEDEKEVEKIREEYRVK